MYCRSKNLTFFRFSGSRRLHIQYTLAFDDYCTS